MDIEKAILRLNEISSEMSKGDISLQQSLDLYKESAELIEFCNKTIKESKLIIEEYRNVFEM
ncbi:MAG: exodeoxyribonuclease VII small subunit [Ruminococcaceae bacterium]|nr:exodeoxyribonuclease VII small subunit [Oscillospiraceae bacterium]